VKREDFELVFNSGTNDLGPSPVKT
jgi:hypothetical protein